MSEHNYRVQVKTTGSRQQVQDFRYLDALNTTLQSFTFNPTSYRMKAEVRETLELSFEFLCNLLYGQFFKSRTNGLICRICAGVIVRVTSAAT